MSQPARWWRTLEDGRIECFLCPRRCRLRVGQRAFCFVRANQDGRLVLTTWGRSTGFCVDPIEKKPLCHFLPGTPVLSFGTAGCNLGCRFCQNWQTSRSREVDALCDRAGPETIAAAARRLGCASVAFTYNDPVVFAEYALDVAAACRAAGIRTVAVTAGYVAPEAREEFFAGMDAANVDLKAFRDDFYRRLCLAPEGALAAVLDTLAWIRHESRTWLEITTLLIPGANDDPEEIRAGCRWIVAELGPDVPLHFTAFHPDFRLQDHPGTPAATLRRAREIAHEEGLRFVYTGNVHDPEGQSTRCPGCGQLLVGRDGFEIRSWRLAPGGRCPDCRLVLPGVFGARPGTWGSRRLPVRIGAD